MNAHIEWDTLNDFVDAALTIDERAAAARHLDVCVSCRDRLAELRCLLAAASDVPERVEPPEDLWPALQAEIERRQVVPITLGISSASSRPSAERSVSVRERRSSRTPLLAAAALVLVAGSSAITALVLRSDGATPFATGRSESTLVRALPASLAFTERAYVGSAEELQSLLDAQRDSLAPETVATVERALAEIDAAIIEARAALLRDPRSQVLADLFLASHRQKLDLLRRASELSAQT